MTTIVEVFKGLASLPRWVPYRKVYNPKTEKWDKIPNNGKRNVSSKKPEDWTNLIEATDSSEAYALPGVGIMMTGGIEQAGWRLLGLDFDHVDFDHWQPPFPGYSELSPSETGVRMFAWVPIDWAYRFKDTLKIKYPDCDHAEFYIGTSARYLTVTFRSIELESIPNVTGDYLLKLEVYMNKAEKEHSAVIHIESGSPVNFDRFGLTPEHRQLIDGTGNLDRSSVLHSLMIKLIDENVSPDDVFATVVKTPTLWKICLDHRHDDDTRALEFARQEVERAYGNSMIGKREALVGYHKDWRKPIVPKPVSDYQPFPSFLVEQAPPLLKEIIDWLLKASYAPRIEFAYTSALSMMSCLIGPYCTYGDRQGKLNLYLVLVGGTGSGKNESIDQMVHLINQTDAKDCVCSFPASEAALRRQLGVSSNLLIRVDEMAHKLESMQGSANGTGLGGAILEAYNGARMPPKAYADERKCLPAVENPYVQVLGGTTDKIWNVLRSANLEDGTLNRFIFICLPKIIEYNRNDHPCNDIPKELKDKLNAFYRDGKRFDLLGDVPGNIGRRIGFEPEVENVMKELDRLMFDNEQKSEYGALYTRFIMRVQKVAAILAVIAGRKTVNMQDFEQAKSFMEWALSNTFAKVNTIMAENNFDRLSKRLVEKLKERGGQMSMRETYKFLHVTRREVEELLGTLKMQGAIDVLKDDEPVRGGYFPEWVVLMNEEEPPK